MHYDKTLPWLAKSLLLALLAAACGSPTPQPNLVGVADVATDLGGDLSVADDATPTDDAEPGADAAAQDSAATDATEVNDTAGDAVVDAAVQDVATLDVTATDVAAPDAQVADADASKSDVAADTGPDASTGDVPVDTGPDVPACNPASCDDADACTTDGCDAKGACTHVAVLGCKPPAALPCSTSTDCKGGACDSSSHVCVPCLVNSDCGVGKLCEFSATVGPSCQAAAACQSDSQCKATQQVCSKADGACVDCLDGNDCKSGSVCVQHTCVPAPTACQSSKDCPGVLVCDKAKSACVGCLGAADCPATSFCNANQQCAADVCSGGVCGAGSALFACKPDGSGYEAGKACDDANPCTDNVCQPGAGCVYPAGGSACSDGSVCTDKDTCAGGKCVGGPAISCDDANPCTADLCNPTGGCSHTANTAACDDGDTCSTNDKCQGGSCVGGSPKNCDDANPCTTDGCAKNACTHSANNASCDDGKGCTTNDKCSGGGCTGGTAKVCTDNDECTDDSCNAATGACVNAKKPGCVNSVAPPCTEGDCSNGVCDPALHACVGCFANSQCPAGNVCIGHACKIMTGCTSDTQCKATKQVCNAGQKACVDCNAKTDCAGSETCIGNVCIPAPACKSSKDCPDVKVCDTGKGVCVECSSSADCLGGKWCDGNGQCQASLCKTQACWKGALFVCKADGGGYSTPVNCLDGNVCTDDGCDATAGCTFKANTAACTGSPEACSSQCAVGKCVAKPPYLFDKTYGGNHDEYVNGTLALSDGYLLIGRVYTNFDAGYLVRTDLAGNKSWDKAYNGGSGYNALSSGVQGGGGFTLVGTKRNNNSNSEDLWLLRVKADGSFDWDKTFGSTALERGYGIVALSDGYLLVGRSEQKGNSEGWIVRTDLNGGKTWETSYGTAGYDALYDVAMTSDGGYIMAGTSQPKSGDYDGWLVRTDAAGNKLWDKTYGAGKNDWFNGLTQAPDGSIVAIGQTTTSFDTSMWLVRTDKVGAALWTRTYDATGTVQGESVIQLADGYQLVGTIKADSKENIWTVRTDASGNSVWSQKFGGTSDDSATALVKTADGGVAIGGETASKGAGGSDAWLLRIDAWGATSCAASGTCVDLSTADCNDGNACTADSCAAQKGCTYTAIAGCCLKQADCDDANACTTDTCATGNLCKHAFSSGPGCVCDPNLFTDDFEDGTLSPLSQSGSSSSVLWQVDCKDVANGGKCALYYGNPATGNFDNGDMNNGTATLPQVTLPAGKTATLAFSTWLDVETNPDWDKVWVSVTPSGSSSPATLWSKATASNVKMEVWQNWTVDLSAYAGKTVTLKFTMNTGDSTDNGGKGVFVDDIAVTRSCP